MWHDEDDKEPADFEVDPFTWARSSFGNAFFSGVSYRQLWEAVNMSQTPEQLDAAISAIEDLNKLVYGSPKGDSNEGSIPTATPPRLPRQ